MVNDWPAISMHPMAICQEDENGFQFLYQDYIITVWNCRHRSTRISSASGQVSEL